MYDPNPPRPARTVEEAIGFDAALEIAMKYGLVPQMTDREIDMLKEARKREFHGFFIA